MKKQPNHAVALLIAPAALLALTVQSPAQDFPNPQPTDGHKILADDAGTWDATMKMYFGGPDAPPVEFKGVETSEMVSGGLFARSTFKGKFGDRDFEGHGLMGYDPEAKEYTGMWVDNFNMKPTEIKGKFDAEKKTLTVFITAEGPEGEEMKMKHVTTFIDAKTKKFVNYLLVGEAEIKLMEVDYRRRE